MASSSKFHPALTITNVKSLIPITLDAEHGMYHSWAALFTVLVKVHDLHHHIIPPTEEKEIAAYAASKAEDPSLWKRLDAAVLQWIYGTISTDLLHAILLKDDTAEGAWSRLESMFQDNKASRATHLEEELADLDFGNFSSIDSYCNHIKSLADRLADVDAPISNSRLVLKLTGGLPEAYAGTVDFIQNQEPLPSFESCRSRLKLAERTIKNRLAKEGHPGKQAALVANSGNHGSDSTSGVSRPSSNSKNKQKKTHNKPKKSHGGGQDATPQTGSAPLPWPHQPWGAWTPWLGQWSNSPPCPYPATSWPPKPPAAGPRQPGQGLLGPRPQAYTVSAPYSSYTPTDIEAAMHALSSPPPDGNFYMDTGATSHMTADQDGSQTGEM